MALNKLCSTLEWQYIEGAIGSLCLGVMQGVGRRNVMS